MKAKIALKKRNSIVLQPYTSRTSVKAPSDITAQVASFSAAMIQLGFIPTAALLKQLECRSPRELSLIYDEYLPAMSELKGANVQYKPMYPNFPTQVMEASEAELYYNAILHYVTFGQAMPHYNKDQRLPKLENTKLIKIDVITEEEFKEIPVQIVSSNESISEFDKQVVKWFLDNTSYRPIGEIKFKENLCFVASILLQKGEDISGFVKTATDILRIAVSMSGGDISLSTNTKFKSFPRKVRKILARLIADLASLEDLNRHRGQWVRLFHSLHIGEFSNKLFTLAEKIRSGDTIETFNSKVQKALGEKNIPEVIELLSSRPGEFARRLDHILRISNSSRGGPKPVITAFLRVAYQVDTRILVQLLGHLKTRSTNLDSRIVFPKGVTTKATVLRQFIPALDARIVSQLTKTITKILEERFNKCEHLGNVWIDKKLKDCPIPTAQRTASEGLIQVARGTRLPFGNDKNTLRFFIYWVGQDIDLSASFHDEKFNMIEHVSYSNLRSEKLQTYHSGDVTYAPAPYGASEFIDISIDDAVKSGKRYVVMNVYVFSGPNFSEHDVVYAGWMTRSHPKSNEIYDPKTVEQKINVTAPAKGCIPVIFDLVTREAIWVDLAMTTRYGFGSYRNWDAISYGNNVQANRASVEQSIEAIVNSKNKLNLYDLFTLHANARGKIVKARKDADIVFAIDGDVTPFDISKIQSEYL